MIFFDILGKISDSMIIVAAITWGIGIFKKRKSAKKMGKYKNAIALAITIPSDKDEAQHEIEKRRNDVGDFSGDKAEINMSIGIQNQVFSFILKHDELREAFGITQTDFSDKEKAKVMDKCIYAITTKAMPSSKDEDYKSAEANLFINDLLKEVDKFETSLRNNSVADRTICLFYQGPTMAIAPIAAKLSNRLKIELYQFDPKNKTYYCIGSMDR